MRHLLQRRILFFGGKGGVGKTTCSSAFAVAASRAGKRVLLVSTDPAHSTGDIFEMTIGPAPRELLPRLSAVEIDPDVEVRKYVDAAKKGLAGLFSDGVVKEAARQIELAASMPGVAETALLDRVSEIVLSHATDHDLVVFDTAPSGHTLRLLRLPELMNAWVDALTRRRREATAAARVSNAGPGEGPDRVLELLHGRAARLAALRAELSRRDRVGFVLVLIPERLPIEETARAAHLLEDAAIDLAALVVNRVLPERADGEYVRARRAREAVYLAEIERRFSFCPRFQVPQLEADVHGVEALDQLGRSLLG